MRSLPLIVLLSVSATLVACGASSDSGAHGCTEIGCVNGFNVKVTSSGAWKAGKYTVTVVADGVTTTCTADLPLTPQSTASCSAAGVQIGLSGSALPAEQHSISDVALTATPKSVMITIARDGTSIGAQSFTPAYKTSRPNGATCEPVCTNASDTLAVVP